MHDFHWSDNPKIMYLEMSFERNNLVHFYTPNLVSHVKLHYIVHTVVLKVGVEKPFSGRCNTASKIN